MILPGVSFSFLYQHELSLESPNNVLKHKVTKMSVTIIYVRCIVTMCNGVVECNHMGSMTRAYSEVLIKICPGHNSSVSCNDLKHLANLTKPQNNTQAFTK